MNQQFDVLEDIGQSKIIGRVNASDLDGDILSFKPKSDIDLIIEPSTGVVKTIVNSILDYQTNTTIRFDVCVKDSNGAIAITTITMNVLDVYEGPLNSLQKSFLDEYIYVIYQLDYLGKLLSEKWEGEIRIFLDGNIASDYQQLVTASLNEFNSYLTDGTTIKLVNTLETSNVHLIMGLKSLVQPIWPDMFDLIEHIGYSLYYSTDRHNICKGRIWVNLSGSRSLFMHELDHIIGLGDSSDNYCVNKERPVLCAQKQPLNLADLIGKLLKLYIILSPWRY